MSSLNQKASSFTRLPVKKAKKKDTNAWMLSYGDMVTALLCFFILFYAIEKQIQKKANANPVKGYSEAEGILREHKSAELDTEYNYAIEALGKIPGISVMRTSGFVDIHFNKTIFFNLGDVDLTAEGKQTLDAVISKLSKIEGKYLLEIQGHADSTRVRKSRNRWWQSNMELSVLRALTVHSYLSENYIERNNLVVSGYGNQKKMSDNAENIEDINRRISLRLQLVK